jgi:hypothetical protein
MDIKEIKKEAARTQKHEDIFDLADKFLNEALDNGEPFTEGLTNWSIEKAKREVK